MGFLDNKFVNKIVIYWRTGRFFSDDIRIASTAHPSRDCIFEGMNAIHPHAFYRGKLGYGSYVGNGCNLSADVGKFSSISPMVRSNSGRHPYKQPYVATAPCFYSCKNKQYQNGSSFADDEYFSERIQYDEKRSIDVNIGSDCWIGEGVFIAGGIKIADGAVVYAHAVVTKDVPPYAIVGGVPARILGYRYDDETINFLMKIRWWNNDKEWFDKNWKSLNSIEQLKALYAKK